MTSTRIIVNATHLATRELSDSPMVQYPAPASRWTSSAMHRPNRDRPRLTKRETQVLLLIARGFNSKEMACGLNLSKPTVETFVRRLMTKLEARSRPHLVANAFTIGLLRIDSNGELSVGL